MDDTFRRSFSGSPLKIAVIGGGPRALGALEALLRQRHGPLQIDLFEARSRPGAGPNFSPDQSPLMLLNLPLREVRLGQGQIASFTEWLGEAGGTGERYPARAELGEYLEARLAALIASAPGDVRIQIHSARVHSLAQADHGWHLRANGSFAQTYDEVLLAQGQPATRPDDQLARWRDHSDRCGADLLPAYPAHRLLSAARDWQGRQVGIRGFGLSTLDVVRLLTLGVGGRFEDGRYRRSGREPARILPFSLDGQAPAPKPATAALDARFDPTDAETQAYRAAVQAAINGPAPDATATLCTALRDPALRILRETGANLDPAALDHWLAVEPDKPASQETRGIEQALAAHIAEARGEVPPSPGYVVGQLVRKWQDTLREVFNPTDVPAATAKALVSFDEGLKRYSYGPPVSAASELLILIRDGIVDPRAAEDPKVKLVDDGWLLVEGDARAHVTAMVDAVLPAPDLAEICDPVVTTLMRDGHAVAVGDGLGARTGADGRLIGKDDAPRPGLSMLGRMANGSVIAVDSIHDCFGAAADRWAKGVVQRAAPALRQI